MEPIFDDVLVSILVDGEFYPILCATDMSLSTRQEVLLATTADTGTWRMKRLRRLSEWSVTLTGLTKINNTDGQISYFYLLQENIRGTEQTIRVVFEDTDGNIQVITGTVIIPDITFSSSVGGFADVNVTFEGSGSFSIQEAVSGPGSGESGSGLCEVLMSDTWILAEGETAISGVGLDGKSFAAGDILEVNREGTQYDYTNGSPGNREFAYDGTEISFENGGQPGGETVHVLWRTS